MLKIGEKIRSCHTAFCAKLLWPVGGSLLWGPKRLAEVEKIVFCQILPASHRSNNGFSRSMEMFSWSVCQKLPLGRQQCKQYVTNPLLEGRHFNAVVSSLFTGCSIHRSYLQGAPYSPHFCPVSFSCVTSISPTKLLCVVTFQPLLLVLLCSCCPWPTTKFTGFFLGSYVSVFFCTLLCVTLSYFFLETCFHSSFLDLYFPCFVCLFSFLSPLPNLYSLYGHYWGWTSLKTMWVYPFCFLKCFCLCRYWTT